MVLVQQVAFWCLVLKIWLCYALNKGMNGTCSTRNWECCLVFSFTFVFKDRIPHFKRKHVTFCTDHFCWGHQLRIAAPNIQLNHCLTLKAIEFPISNIQLNHCLTVAALNSQLYSFSFATFELVFCVIIWYATCISFWFLASFIWSTSFFLPQIF